MKQLPWVYILFGVGALYMAYKYGEAEAKCKMIAGECMNPRQGTM